MRNHDESPRAYEARHFPVTHRLDLHAEGPPVARRRALRWIEIMAHEHPGVEVLLVVERGGPVRRQASPVRAAVEALLEELHGALIERWQRFGPDGLAVRISHDPDRFREPVQPNELEVPDGAEKPEPLVDPASDIPVELRPIVRRGAELWRMREGHGVALEETLMRRLWISAQAEAMTEGRAVEDALDRLVAEEERAVYEEEDGDVM